MHALAIFQSQPHSLFLFPDSNTQADTHKNTHTLTPTQIAGLGLLAYESRSWHELQKNTQSTLFYNQIISQSWNWYVSTEQELSTAVGCVCGVCLLRHMSYTSTHMHRLEKSHPLSRGPYIHTLSFKVDSFMPVILYSGGSEAQRRFLVALQAVSAPSRAKSQCALNSNSLFTFSFVRFFPLFCWEKLNTYKRQERRRFHRNRVWLLLIAYWW